MKDYKYIAKHCNYTLTENNTYPSAGLNCIFGIKGEDDHVIYKLGFYSPNLNTYILDEAATLTSYSNDQRRYDKLIKNIVMFKYVDQIDVQAININKLF